MLNIENSFREFVSLLTTVVTLTVTISAVIGHTWILQLICDDDLDI